MSASLSCCLKTLVSSKLHFDMCNLDSSTIENVDIQDTVKSTVLPLILYPSQFWVDSYESCQWRQCNSVRLLLDSPSSREQKSKKLIPGRIMYIPLARHKRHSISGQRRRRTR